MRPPAGVLLDQAHGAGGARALLERQLRAELDDFFVRAAQRQVQEAERIEQRLGRVPEGFEDHLLRDLGRARAIGVAAHAVDDDEQRGVLGDRGGDPVLVLLAASEQADIGVLDPQEGFRASVRLRLRFISPAQTSVTAQDCVSLDEP